MKQNSREQYEAPLTERTLIGLESGICAGSTNPQNPDDANTGQIKEHEKNDGFGFNEDQWSSWD